MKGSVNFPVKTVNWLKTLFGLSFVLAVFSVYLSLSSILHLDATHLATPAYLMFLFYVFVLILGITPLYFPSILYGLPQFASSQKELLERNLDAHKLQKVEDDSIRFGIDESQLLNQLRELELKEVYLLPDFNLDSLAVQLEMPVHHVSYFLNHHFNQSFSEYRTSLRMKTAQILIEQGFFEQNTIEALAWKCGFSSRSAFTKSFKLHTGFNPSEYPIK
jgi:AraC-like DNA-binding protein